MIQKITKRRFYFICGAVLIVSFLILGIGVNLNAGWLEAFDNFGDQVLRLSITDFNTSFFKIITSFGSIGLIVMVTAVVSGVLWLSKEKNAAIWLSGTVMVCGGAIPYLFKLIFRRERPMFKLIPETGFSFPSGHASSSTVLYGALIVLALLFIKKTWKKYLTVSLAAVLVMMIICSRVYLGVHYPSDVIGGLLLGSGQVLIATGIYLSYQSLKAKQNEEEDKNDE
ncbi:phosphatase PAP2 family protein [Metaclostridioides mangenotii]